MSELSPDTASDLTPPLAAVHHRENTRVPLGEIHNRIRPVHHGVNPRFDALCNECAAARC